jgi:hypothetical protein
MTPTATFSWCRKFVASCAAESTLTFSNPQQDKGKWATFTYLGTETRIITNLFQSTNIKFAFKTTNTIQRHLRAKGTPRDIYNQSGIYRLQCGECPLKYVRQTGRTFRERYREHINATKSNKQHSKFASHILDSGHSYNTMDQTLEVLHIEKKGLKLNTLGRFYIYDLTKKGLQLNDTFSDMCNPIFDILVKTYPSNFPTPSSSFQSHTALPPLPSDPFPLQLILRKYAYLKLSHMQVLQTALRHRSNSV